LTVYIQSGLEKNGAKFTAS